MTTTTAPITPAEAATELKRRSEPKGSAERRLYPRQEVMDAGSKELKALATGEPVCPLMPAKATKAKAAKPTKAAAKKGKPERTEIQKLHTRLRAEAYAWKIAQFHEGNPVTVPQAYAKFGTAKAAITNAPGFTGI